MDKPIIGISGSEIIDEGGMFPGYRRSYVNEDYVDSVVKNGGIPFIIPFTENDEVIKEQLDHVQGLILSGGHDVDPHLYNEEPLQKLGTTWPERDHFDMLLLKLAEEKRNTSIRDLSWFPNHKCVSWRLIISRFVISTRCDVKA